MHILWINELASQAGGCENYILQTASLLQERKNRCSLFYNPENPTTPQFLRAFQGAFPLVDLKSQLQALHPDLIFVHQWNGIDTLDLIRRSGIPSVRFLHDHKLFCLREYKYTALGRHTCTRKVGWGCYPCLGFVNRSPSWPGISLTRVKHLRRRQQASHFFDAFVVGSQYMAGEATRHGFNPERIRVIPLYATPPSPVKQEAKDSAMMLFVGQLIRGKGLDILLRAMTLTRRPMNLVVAGSGKQESMFRNLSRGLGLEKRVTFAGWQSTMQLAELYERTAFLVVPSRGPESFSLVGIEAHSHGTCVIASAIGGVGEWLEHDQTGLAVPPGNPRALARAMDRLQQDPSLASQLAEEGRRRYQARFRPEFHVDSLQALFHQLINQKGNP